jgi:hypothetical protein
MQGFIQEVSELATMSKASATTYQIEEHGKSWQSKFVWTTSFKGFRTFFPILLPGNQLSTSNCTNALLRSRRNGICPRLEQTASTTHDVILWHLAKSAASATVREQNCSKHDSNLETVETDAAVHHNHLVQIPRLKKPRSLLRDWISFFVLCNKRLTYNHLIFTHIKHGGERSPRMLHMQKVSVHNLPVNTAYHTRILLFPPQNISYGQL